MAAPGGDVRNARSRKIKTDHALALKLWETGNVDAQLLATLITIAVKATPFPSVLDAVVWGTTGLMLLARWYDITRFNGRTLSDESATVGHWRRYAMLVVGGTLGAWLLARWFAGSFQAGP